MLFASIVAMEFIQGTNRHQTYFSTLEQQVVTDNPVRIIDAFIDKLDLQKLGFTHTIHKSEGRPPYAPPMLLKLYLYGYPKPGFVSPRTCFFDSSVAWSGNGATTLIITDTNPGGGF